MRIKNVLILFLLILSESIIFTQEIELPFTGELDIKFKKDEREQLIESVISIQEGKVLLAEAKSMYDELDHDKKQETNIKKNKELKEIYKKFESSIEAFDKGYNTVYDIYKKNCNNFWDVQREQNHYATGLEKAKYYERMATRSLGRANTKRGDASISKKFEEAYNITLSANSYFFQGMRSQGRALQIYQDYPVEYNYNWENDIDIDKIITERRGKIVEEAQVDTSIQRFQNDTNLQESKIVYIHDTIFIILKDSLDFEDSTITFRVQIAAHTQPLSQQFLRTIYYGSRDIFELEEEGWYKYSIGIFKDYFEAKKVKDNSGVKKAFIVPYVSGRKIPIKDALERMGIKPDN